MRYPHRGVSAILLAATAMSTFAVCPAQAAPNPGPPSDPGGTSSSESKSTHCSRKLEWVRVAGLTKTNVRVRQYVAAKDGKAVTCNESKEVKANSKTSLKVKAFYSWKKSKTVNGKTKVELYTVIPAGQCVAVDTTLVRPGPNFTLTGPDICSR